MLQTLGMLRPVQQEMWLSQFTSLRFTITMPLYKMINRQFLNSFSKIVQNKEKLWLTHKTLWTNIFNSVFALVMLINIWLKNFAISLFSGRLISRSNTYNSMYFATVRVHGRVFKGKIPMISQRNIRLLFHTASTKGLMVSTSGMVNLCELSTLVRGSSLISLALGEGREDCSVSANVIYALPPNQQKLNRIVSIFLHFLPINLDNCLLAFRYTCTRSGSEKIRGRSETMFANNPEFGPPPPLVYI